MKSLALLVRFNHILVALKANGNTYNRKLEKEAEQVFNEVFNSFNKASEKLSIIECAAKHGLVNVGPNEAEFVFIGEEALLQAT